MQKITVNYKNTNDELVEEDFYFNINAKELIQLEAEEGISSKIKEIIGSKDMMRVFKVFTDICVLAYGIRTSDGRFYKDPIETKIFASGNAIDEVVFVLLKDEKLASDFVNNVIPSDIVSRLEAEAGTVEPQDHKKKAVK